MNSGGAMCSGRRPTMEGGNKRREGGERFSSLCVGFWFLVGEGKGDEKEDGKIDLERR